MFEKTFHFFTKTVKERIKLYEQKMNEILGYCENDTKKIGCTIRRRAPIPLPGGVHLPAREQSKKRKKGNGHLGAISFGATARCRASGHLPSLEPRHFSGAKGLGKRSCLSRGALDRRRAPLQDEDLTKTKYSVN